MRFVLPLTSGFLASTTVEPNETVPPTSLAGKIQALTAFKNFPTSNSTHHDIKEAVRGIKPTGTNDT